MEKDEDFLERLLLTFRGEATEHLDGISLGLVELEKVVSAEARAVILEKIFREAHSLKGAAHSVDQAGMESLCQAMESVFSALGKGTKQPSPKLFDMLQDAVDRLGALLLDAKAVNSNDAGRTAMDRAADKSLAEALKEASADAAPARKTASPPELSGSALAKGGDSAAPEKTACLEVETHPSAPDTLRVSANKLLSLLLQAEELLSAKLSAQQLLADFRAGQASLETWEKMRRKVPLQVGGIGALGSASPNGSAARLREFLLWNDGFMEELKESWMTAAKSAERGAKTLGSLVDALLADAKKVLMLPLSTLFDALPILVRKASREAGKEVDLVLEGGDIEIDKRILEAMKDPLVHLIRNCVDHGIEEPSSRKAKGKAGRGTIRIAATPKDDKFELEISDDGAGVPVAALRSAVARLGVVSREEAEILTDDELLAFLFRSGVSTSPILTELSGRGLGLAIVREKVEALSGSVAIETRKDEGTLFRILLPLTIATFRGVLVRVGLHDFVLPALHVERAARVNGADLRSVEGRETISLGGPPLLLAHLAAVLELPEADRVEPSEEDSFQVIVLSAAGTRIAFLVDEVVGEQEVLLKGLGALLSRVRNVSGAIVLGTGRLVPILNVPDLIKSALGRGAWNPASAAKSGKPRRRSVLVAEDSITTRTLLKNILESAGYEAVTAVDGAEAFAKLKEGSFDAVVSDIRMPRMDGFELTARIRGEEAFRELPVLLVTSLDSSEDRERGMDVGASAYIVKSSFDQGDLLRTLEKFL